MRILISYRMAQRISGWETGAMMARAFRRQEHDVDEYGLMYETGEWMCDAASLRNQDYDLHVFMECNDPSRQYLETRDIKCGKRVFCVYDTSYYPQMIKNVCNAMQFDWVFSANPLFGQNFFGPCTSQLAYAADPGLHFRDMHQNPDRFIAMPGSDRADRRKLVDAIRRSHMDVSMPTGMFKEDYVNVLADSCIVLNENPPEGKGLLNMRTFEAPAAGALLLAQEGDFIADHFVPGTEVMTYRDTDSLVQACKSLAEDPDMTRRIRAAGQRRVFEHHTYDHRVQDMLDVLGY